MPIEFRPIGTDPTENSFPIMSEVEYIANNVRERRDALDLQISPPVITVERGQEASGSRQDPTIFFLAADLVLVFVAAYLATSSHFSLAGANWEMLSETSIAKHFGFFVLYAGLLILSCHVYKVYAGKETRSARQEQLALLKAVGMATLLVTAFIFLSGIKIISRVVVGETVVSSTVGSSCVNLRRLSRRNT